VIRVSEPRLLRAGRRLAHLTANAYPRPVRASHGSADRAPDRDIHGFVDDAVTDGWREGRVLGLARVLGTLGRDVLVTRWRGPGLTITAIAIRDSRPHPPGATGRRHLMDTVLNDARLAVRRLARAPGFTAIAVTTLALGIGLTTAVFTVVDQSILRPFSYPDIDRMVVMNERFETEQMSVSWPNFLDWKAQNTALQELGIYRNAAVNLTGGDQPERLSGSIVSASVFVSTGIAPLLGRVFSDADDRPGSDRVAVISERLWRTHFGADRDVAGQRVTLNGEPYTIVGVMPAAMRFPSRLTDVWLSVGPMAPTFPTARDNHPGLMAIGRLKPGVSLDAARTAMEATARRLGVAYPTTNSHTHVVVNAYRDLMIENIRPAFRLLLGAVGLVLLIACANLASLMLARADGRQRELAVRAALGASRWRLVHHLLAEAAVLALVGGGAGVLIAYWSVRAFVASHPTTIPRIDLIGVDSRVLIFALAVSTVAGVLFGSVPALRGSAVALQGALRNGRDGSVAGARRLRQLLIVAEVAMAFLLLVGAGLFGRSLVGLLSVDLGFEPSRLVTMELALPAAAYPSVDAWLTFHRTLLEHMAGAPGVDAVALATSLPLSGNAAESSLIREGDPLPTPDHPPAECTYVAVSRDYFRTMAIHVVRGRTFSARDTSNAPPVIVVDDGLAARIFPNQDPIGHRISFEGTGDSPATFVPIWREIVGVVHHVRQYGLTDEPPYVQVFTPVDQLPIWMRDRRPALSLVVRTTGAPDSVVAVVRRTVRGIDPNIPVYGLETMGAAIDGATEQPRLSLLLIGAFAILALVLAIVGVYGILAQTVTQQTREIGVRMALGARRGQVGGLVARQAAALVVTGLLVGACGAVGLSHFLRALLFEVSPTDPETLVGMACLLAITAAIAAAIPARRASGVDPVVALRME
jgi:putative ABC transport system permease protein